MRYSQLTWKNSLIAVFSIVFGLGLFFSGYYIGHDHAEKENKNFRQKMLTSFAYNAFDEKLSSIERQRYLTTINELSLQRTHKKLANESKIALEKRVIELSPSGGAKLLNGTEQSPEVSVEGKHDE